MKPNFADIQYTVGNRNGFHVVSDGTTLWKYNPATQSYTRTPADPQGKNVTLWNLTVIGGFFDLQGWMARNVGNDLSYAGTETIHGTSYEVLEHKTMGMIQGKSCPFDDKFYVGPDNFIHRFTLDFTLDGQPGSELAELTNIKTNQAMAAGEFVFEPPPGSSEEPTSR
jgi:outer membrane lipoprotein-sorting protein